MKKSARAAKPAPKAEASRPIPPVADIEAIRARYQQHLDDCAWAAVCGAGMLENMVQIRSVYVKNLIAEAPWICDFADKPLAKRDLLLEQGLEHAVRMFGAAELAANNLHENLRIFRVYIDQLDKAYREIEAANGISAFKAIRQTARQFDRERHPSKADLWEYVLKYWETINPTVVRIARWRLWPDDKEESFMFDEKEQVWRHAVSGSEIRIGSSFAIAK